MATRSAQQLVDDEREEGHPMCQTWPISRPLTRSDWFKCVPQMTPLMTDEYKQKEKGEDWRIAHRDYNFDNVIFTDESGFQFYRCT